MDKNKIYSKSMSILKQGFAGKIAPPVSTDKPTNPEDSNSDTDRLKKKIFGPQQNTPGFNTQA